MRISDWSSDVCSSDLLPPIGLLCARNRWLRNTLIAIGFVFPILVIDRNRVFASVFSFALVILLRRDEARPWPWKAVGSLGFAGVSVFSILGMLRSGPRSEEHTSELQYLMRISYA